MFSEYYKSVNQNLLALIPNEALNIIEVGCAEGQLGAILKEINPNRYIVGFEYVESVADVARTRLDEVYVGDIQTLPIPESIKKDSIDCIIFGDVLEHLPQAQIVLEKFHPYLKKNGVIISCIPNVQNQEIIQQLLTQNFQYHQAGLLDKTHTNLMTLPNIFKMFLDAQYRPFLHSINNSELDENFYNSLTKTFKHLNVDLEYTKKTLAAFQYLVIAYPNYSITPELKLEPTTIIVKEDHFIDYVNNINISPDYIKNQNISLKSIRNNKAFLKNAQLEIFNTPDKWIILTQDNVYLPKNWIGYIQNFWDQCEKTHNYKIGVLGVSGLEKDSGQQISNYIMRDESIYSECTTSEVNNLLSSVLIFRTDRFIPDLTKFYNFHTIGLEINEHLSKLNLKSHIIDSPCFINTTAKRRNITQLHNLYQHPIIKLLRNIAKLLPKNASQMILHKWLKFSEKIKRL